MIRYFLPATVFFLISVVLLTLPGSAFPEENWMGDLQVDKIVHIGMFGILTFLLCWGFWKNGKTNPKNFRYFLISAIAAFVYGIIMEYVQRDFIVNRSFDIGDIIADGVGAATGFLFSWYRFIKK